MPYQSGKIKIKQLIPPDYEGKYGQNLSNNIYLLFFKYNILNT